MLIESVNHQGFWYFWKSCCKWYWSVICQFCHLCICT